MFGSRLYAAERGGRERERKVEIESTSTRIHIAEQEPIKQSRKRDRENELLIRLRLLAPFQGEDLDGIMIDGRVDRDRHQQSRVHRAGSETRKISLFNSANATSTEERLRQAELEPITHS